MGSTRERSFEEYLEAGGWSSSRFLPHARVAIPVLQSEYSVTFRRTFVTVSSGGRSVQLRVHYGGRDRNWLSVVDGQREVSAHHHTETPTAVLDAVRAALTQKPQNTSTCTG